MSEYKNFFSPVLYAVLLICFFLPFFNLTCQNQKIASITGYDLMIGTTITPPQLYNTASQQESISTEPLAIITFLIAAAALILSFFKKAALPVAALSLVGLVTLLLLSSKINGDISGRIELQGLTMEWAIGMYIAFFIFIITTALNAYLIYDNKYSTVDLDQYTERMKVCFNCGTPNDRGNVYCSKCGNMLA